MQAIIRTGGKQYRVSEGDKLNVETLSADAGGAVEFTDVLLVSDGDDVAVGTPLVPGARVTATVLEHGRGEKIRVVKFKRRKNYRRTQGHRQNYTRVEITGVTKG